MTVRIAIVEDEEKARETLKDYIKRFGDENDIAFLVDTYVSPLMLLEKYKAEYDIIFMDIQMPDINGMDAAKRIRALDASVGLIFVTSLAQYAIQGYEVEALDYILKPVQYYNFALKMTKAIRHLNSDENDGLMVPTGYGTARISLRDVTYIDVQDHLLTYHTFDGTYSEFQTISSLEKLLSDKGFARCSNSCLVNLRYVQGIKGYTLYMQDGTELRISQPRKRSLVNAVESYQKLN